MLNVAENGVEAASNDGGNRVFAVDDESEVGTLTLNSEPPTLYFRP